MNFNEYLNSLNKSQILNEANKLSLPSSKHWHIECVNPTDDIVKLYDADGIYRDDCTLCNEDGKVVTFDTLYSNIVGLFTTMNHKDYSLHLANIKDRLNFLEAKKTSIIKQLKEGQTVYIQSNEFGYELSVLNVNFVYEIYKDSETNEEIKQVRVVISPLNTGKIENGIIKIERFDKL